MSSAPSIQPVEDVLLQWGDPSFKLFYKMWS